MKWWMLLAGVAGLLALSGLAVYLVGRSLPTEHVAERTLAINAGINRVAERIRAVEEQPRWRHKITRVDVQAHDGLTVRYTEYTGSDAIAFELTEQQHGRRFESRIISTDLPFGGCWLITLSPLDGGQTSVHIREEGIVHPPFFRALSHYVLGHTATMEAYLGDLARSFAGE